MRTKSSSKIAPQENLKVLQYFSDEYIEACKKITPLQIAEFLESYRLLHGHQEGPSKLISIKIPENLLSTFRTKSELHGVRYQTQIKNLMKKWVEEDSTE